MHRFTRTTATTIAALTLAGTLALAGCSPSTPSTGAPEEGPAGEAITISDAWVMSAESGMSSAFGEIINPTDRDIAVVSATSPASSMLELHETVENETGEMVMREVEGGFVIGADSALTLAPGGDHIMLMDLVDPLLAGDDVTFTLTFDDGSSIEYSAPVKDYAGGNETYEGGSSHSSDDMEH